MIQWESDVAGHRSEIDVWLHEIDEGREWGDGNVGIHLVFAIGTELQGTSWNRAENASMFIQGLHGAWLYNAFNHVKTIGPSQVGLEGTQRWK